VQGGKAHAITVPVVRPIAPPQAKAATRKKDSRVKHFVPEFLALASSVAVTAGLVFLPQAKDLLGYVSQHMSLAREISDAILIGGFHMVTGALVLWAVDVKERAFKALAAVEVQVPAITVGKPKAQKAPKVPKVG
jgi:hypothetical protein